MTDSAFIPVLRDIDRIKKQLKEVKKSIREEEKIDTNDYVHLKKSVKDLRRQIKDIEEANDAELKNDKSYIALKELREKLRMELAVANEKLAKLMSDLPPKQLEFNFQNEDGEAVRVHIYPQMKLFMNGKEERL